MLDSSSMAFLFLFTFLFNPHNAFDNIIQLEITAKYGVTQSFARTP